MDKFLRPPKIAEALGVAPHTVCRWITDGQLRASNVASGKKKPRWVVAEQALNEFLDARATKPRPTPPRSAPPAPREWSRELDESERQVRDAYPDAKVIQRAGGFVVVSNDKQLSQAASCAPDRAWRSAARKLERLRQ